MVTEPDSIHDPSGVTTTTICMYFLEKFRRKNFIGSLLANGVHCWLNQWISSCTNSLMLFPMQETVNRAIAAKTGHGKQIDLRILCRGQVLVI